MISEKTAGILQRVRLVKDEAILDAVTHLLDTYLHAQMIAESGEEVAPDYDPLVHHTPEAIAKFEARDDFMGYSVQGNPLFATEVFEKAEEEIEAIKRGEAKGTSLAEWMQKTRQWQAPTP